MCDWGGNKDGFSWFTYRSPHYGRDVVTVDDAGRLAPSLNGFIKRELTNGAIQVRLPFSERMLPRLSRLLVATL